MRLTKLVASLWTPFGGGAIVAAPAAAADLFEALFTALDADAALAGRFGRAGWLYRDAGPRDTALPVAVVTAVSGHVEWEDDPTQFLEAGEFQLAVHAGGPTSRQDARSLCRRVAAAIEALDATLAYAEATHLYVRRSGPGADVLDPEPAPDGSDVWTHLIPFRTIAGDG